MSGQENTDWTGNKPEDVKDETLETTTEAPSAEPIEQTFEKCKTLEFGTNGWCEELKRSYFTGLYVATSKKEFDALKKYALKKYAK